MRRAESSLDNSRELERNMLWMSVTGFDYLADIPCKYEVPHKDGRGMHCTTQGPQRQIPLLYPATAPLHSWLYSGTEQPEVHAAFMGMRESTAVGLQQVEAG